MTGKLGSWEGYGKSLTFGNQSGYKGQNCLGDFGAVAACPACGDKVESKYRACPACESSLPWEAGEMIEISFTPGRGETGGSNELPVPGGDVRDPSLRNYKFLQGALINNRLRLFKTGEDENRLPIFALKWSSDDSYQRFKTIASNIKGLSTVEKRGIIIFSPGPGASAERRRREEMGISAEDVVAGIAAFTTALAPSLTKLTSIFASRGVQKAQLKAAQRAPAAPAYGPQPAYYPREEKSNTTIYIVIAVAVVLILGVVFMMQKQQPRYGGY
jgi:hypothetical protein